MEKPKILQDNNLTLWTSRHYSDAQDIDEYVKHLEIAILEASRIMNNVTLSDDDDAAKWLSRYASEKAEGGGE